MLEVIIIFLPYGLKLSALLQYFVAGLFLQLILFVCLSVCIVSLANMTSI